MGKKKKKKVNAFLRELKSFRKEGIPLWLDEQPSDPKSIAKAHQIAEVGAYMRDYIANKEGKVALVKFNLIKE